MTRDIAASLATGRSALRVAVLIATVAIIGACSPAAAPGTLSPTATPAPSTTLAPSPTEPSKPPIVKVTPIPGAPDSGVTLKILADHLKWDPSALTAPAGKGWHLQMTNQERTIIHNFTVESGPAFEQRIFSSDNVRKGTYSFDIPALPAGSYLFICTLHTNTMTGTLTIR